MLKIWLPLNSNFKNIGLDKDAVITNTNTTFASGSRYGGTCCTYTTAQNFTITNIPFSSLTSCTISFWAIHNTAK